MDKDLRKGFERLGQAERMLDEEKMSTKNISGIIEINEDIEDQLNTIEHLEKKLKNWNKVFWSGLIVLIIILLYMLYYTIFYHTGADEPTPKILPKKQLVTEVQYFYKTDVPQLDKNAVEHINLHDIGYKSTDTFDRTEFKDPVSSGLIDEDNPVVETSEPETKIETVETIDSDYLYAQYMGKVWYWNKDSNPIVSKSGFYNYDGVDMYQHHTAEELASYIIPNDTVYFWESLVDVFNSYPKTVSVSESNFDLPDLNREFNVSNGAGDIAAVVTPQIVGEANFLFSPEEGNVFIYSAKTAELVSGDKLIDVLVKFDYTITCYDGVDESTVKSAIQAALESETYGNIQSRLKDKNNRKDNKMNIVINAVSSVSSDFSITLNTMGEYNKAGADEAHWVSGINSAEEIYSTGEHSINEKGEYVTGIDKVPEQITIINITDYDIIYSELACAYHYGWY